MRLSQLDMVTRHADARRALLHDLAVLRAKPNPDRLLGQQPLVVTIGGVRQDDALLALVAPVLIHELEARVRQLDRDLEALGVAIS